MPQVRFLIDENVDFSVADFLIDLDCNVKTVVKIKSSLGDKEILALANNENRVIVTNDKDFGQLIFREKLPHKGVILFRLLDESSEAKIKRLKEVFGKYKSKFSGSFIVITEAKVRINQF